MLKRLIEHVLRLEPEQMPQLTLEDAALCATWHAALSARPEAAGQWTRIDDAVYAWLAQTAEASEAGEARRTQWLLRDLLDLMEGGEGEAFGWGELKFLQCVHDLSNRAAYASRFDRVRLLLAPYQQAIRQRLRVLPPPERGLPGLANRLHVLTPEDLLQGTPRVIGRVEGLPVPFTGACTALHGGHARVLGDIPPDTALFVREGSCRIDGDSRGCLVVTGHCDASGTLEGCVVASRGDIRARAVGEAAFAVARDGSVLCGQTRAPRLVYAGREIHVSGDAMGGTYVAPRVHVDGRARGVVLLTSRTATAGQFGNTAQRQSAVALCRRVSILDVDEQLDGEVTRLLRLRERADTRAAALTQRAAQLEEEAEQFARNAVFYICTSEKTHAHLFALQQAQADLAVQRRLTDALLALVVALENRLDQDAAVVAAEAGGPEFADARKLASALPEAGAVARRALERAAPLWSNVEVAAGDPAQATHRLRQARELLAAQMRNSHVSSVEVERHESLLAEAASRIPVFAADEGQSAVQVLRRVVRSQANSAPVARKLHAEFVQQMRGRAEAAANAATRHRQDARRLRQERNALQQRIEREHPGFLDSAPATADAEAFVEGRFEAGVRVCADRFALQPGAAAGPESSLLTEDSGQQRMRVRRNAVGMLAAEPAD